MLVVVEGKKDGRKALFDRAPIIQELSRLLIGNQHVASCGTSSTPGPGCHFSWIEKRCFIYKLDQESYIIPFEEGDALIDCLSISSSRNYLQLSHRHTPTSHACLLSSCGSITYILSTRMCPVTQLVVFEEQCKSTGQTELERAVKIAFLIGLNDMRENLHQI